MIDTILAPTFPRVSDWFGVWAIEPERALALWSMVRDTNWQAHFAAHAARQQVEVAKAEDLTLVPAAGDKSTAIVRLSGELMKTRSSYGGTSTVQARREIRTAARNPAVSGILLHIDSPGGTVSGTSDLAAEVKAARKAKPVFAQIEDTGASAAYWIASQASKVYANAPTAMVGSIGTILAVQKDTSGRVAVFTSGPLKGPGLTGDLNDEQKAYLQGLVNGWQSHFSGAVKTGRRLTDKQLEHVATGAGFLAGTALELKLIDGIQSTEQTLAELAGTK